MTAVYTIAPFESRIYDNPIVNVAMDTGTRIAGYYVFQFRVYKEYTQHHHITMNLCYLDENEKIVEMVESQNKNLTIFCTGLELVYWLDRSIKSLCIGVKNNSGLLSIRREFLHPYATQARREIIERETRAITILRHWLKHAYYRPPEGPGYLKAIKQ